VQHLHDLVALHQHHATPNTNNVDNVCAAVAIDCEMGTAVSGDSELIRVTMIDYFTGVVLVNNIVEPDVPMLHLNTRFSGVSWGDLNNAKRRGTCLAGKAHARSAIWRFVGPGTVVVGHALSNDLRALRWIHGLVVDSFLMEFNHAKMHKDDEERKSEGHDKDIDELTTRMKKSIVSGVEVAVENPKITGQKKKRRGPGQYSLKTLAKKYLHADIQCDNKGHDSFEDAVAARNLVHWMMTNGKRACCEQHAWIDQDKSI
jgi:RNA exonuclease 1